MDIHDLQYFLSVADHGSITRAAQSLRVSQPAVSQVLKGLEETIGRPLFHRVSNGVVLTETGSLLRHHALKIMHAFEDTEEALHMGRTEARQLRLGVLPTLAHDYVPAILRSFLDREQVNPESADFVESISIMQGSTEELLHGVHNGELNLAVVDFPISEPELSVERLWRERLVVIAPVDSEPLPNPVKFENLADSQFITLEAGYGLRDALFRSALDCGFQPKVLFELKSVMGIVGFVQAGFGISFLSARTVSLEAQVGRLQLVETEPAFSRDIGIVWRRDKRLPLFARRFQEYLLNEVKLLTSNHQGNLMI